ncbi:MAG: hypothetical protein KA821_18200 [Chitinophagaceae bacterium]|nr:hypothetical protein [Chitinophagaceae bacterium]
MNHTITFLAYSLPCNRFGLQQGHAAGKTTLFFISTPKAFDPFTPAPVF